MWISFNATVSSVGHTIETWSGNVLDHHMFEGTEPCVLLAKFFFPNSTVDICSITQLLLRLRCVTENQHIASPCADMPKETTQPSCDGLHLVNRNTRYEVVPSCEDTAGILSVPSCDGTHHHSSVSSCDDRHPLLLKPDCERTNVIDRHTRHAVVTSCEDTVGILSAPSCDGLNMFTCRTLKVIGIDFIFQSLLYSDVIL